MAAIDRIYVDKFEDYLLFKEWCEKQPKLKDKYGTECSISNYLYKWESFENEEVYPIFSAPYYIDAYLIINCPFDFIQDELKLNYEYRTQEWIDNTVNVWFEDYNGTGVSGREFISKTDETKYIFIPASGIRWRDSFHCQGDDCAIWSSSLNALNDYNAWGLSSNPYYLNVNCDCRFVGFVIRGVCK